MRRGEQYSSRRHRILTIAAAIATFAVVARVGLLPAAIAAALVALVVYGLMNAPSPYRRHGWGQVRQAVDHKLGIFGGSYPEEPVIEATDHVGRNDPCPCGSGQKYKRCCGGNAR